ncbi:MAG: hypothetical protein V8R55_08300 [Dysosmobacter sp.]
MLFIFLLLRHHGAVLPAGHTGLGAMPSQYFGVWPLVVRKHVPATAPAGRMAVLQSVHQVKNVEADGMVKEIPVHKYGFLFLFWVSGKDIGGFSFGVMVNGSTSDCTANHASYPRTIRC